MLYLIFNLKNKIKTSRYDLNTYKKIYYCNLWLAINFINVLIYPMCCDNSNHSLPLYY